MSVLWWESAGTDEPGDQRASTNVVEHGYWQVGPDGEGWRAQLIVHDENGFEIDADEAFDSGRVGSEQAAKARAESYEADNRDRRKVFTVPVWLHIEAKTAQGAVDLAWHALNDAADLQLTADGPTLRVVYINTPMTPKDQGGTEYAYDLDVRGKPRQ